MRRSSISYFILLTGVCVFYFGSLWLASRSSSNGGSCFSIVQNEQKGYLNQEEQYMKTDNNKQADVTHGEDLNTDLSYSSCRLYPGIDVNTQRNNPLNETLLSTNTTRKANAVIVILCRNSELVPMRRTIREFEDRFNRNFQYPYVFLNDEPFTELFKTSILALTKAPVEFGLVPKEMWSVPEWVNVTVMNEKLADMQSRNILYGGSLSYRHMCRFNSGWFYRHPLLAKYDYYWRVEPGVHFYCDLDYDPFLFMQDNNKLYSFTITLQEIPETIPTIWEHTLRFAHKHGLKTNLLRMFGDENGYNLCHFWSNFEIASLNLWRDPRYQAYFDYLDKTGNFFYERWGDAIVHSLAAGLFLNKSQVHFFTDIGYKHDNFAHCIDDGVLGKCMCPEDTPNFDFGWGSCLPNWNQFPEEGQRWDFLPNGDQIFDDGRVVSRPELAAVNVPQKHKPFIS